VQRSPAKLPYDLINTVSTNVDDLIWFRPRYCMRPCHNYIHTHPRLLAVASCECARAGRNGHGYGYIGFRGDEPDCILGCSGSRAAASSNF
jgi:hypothetical protein